MAKIKIELNSRGIRDLLKSSEMRSGIEQISQSIASSCGDGYSHDTKDMGSRVIASVYAESSEAIKDNLENNTILTRL